MFNDKIGVVRLQRGRDMCLTSLETTSAAGELATDYLPDKAKCFFLRSSDSQLDESIFLEDCSGNIVEVDESFNEDSSINDQCRIVFCFL